LFWFERFHLSFFPHPHSNRKQSDHRVFTTTLTSKEALMAKSHFSFKKRQKELAKKEKQELKRQRKLEKNSKSEEEPNASADEGEDL
jgi:hypothetical protein